jgi:hypothetical protein
MRSIFFAFALFTAACAGNPGKQVRGHTNVAAVRSEISGTIRSTQNDRTITAMGHAEANRAVVYTTNTATGAKQEETWVNDGSGWKLEGATATTTAQTTN